jgi:hypothetical protein
MDDRSYLSVLLTAVAAVLTLMLCSCGTPWGNDTDRNAIACQGYGFYPETPEYAECMKYVESREARRATLTNKPLPPQSPNVVCKTRGSDTDCQAR